MGGLSNLQTLSVIRHFTGASSLFVVGKNTVVFGLRIPRIDLYRLAVVGDGAVELLPVVVDVAAVVVCLRIPGIDLYRLGVIDGGAVELLPVVVDVAAVEVGLRI